MVDPDGRLWRTDAASSLKDASPRRRPREGLRSDLIHSDVGRRASAGDRGIWRRAYVSRTHINSGKQRNIVRKSRLQAKFPICRKLTKWLIHPKQLVQTSTETLPK